jgi:hypothetical protein
MSEASIKEKDDTNLVKFFWVNVMATDLMA